MAQKSKFGSSLFWTRIVMMMILKALEYLLVKNKGRKKR
jgi:hypothetical protein